MSLTRRTFVKAAGALAAPLLLPSSVLGFRAPGTNGAIGVGFIGMGKRAFELFGSFLSNPATRVVAVCDVDTTRRNHAKNLADTFYKSNASGGIASFDNYRELIAMNGVDAVVIATPDHWHINMIIEAAKRKRDIYCEKPLTLTLLECKLAIEAVRKYNVVLQTGSQQRTEYDHRFVKACEYVRNGALGDLLTVHVGVGLPSKPCDLPTEEVEPGLDWDRWLGPAPKRGYNPILAPRGVHTHYPAWREYREYSGGGMTDFGAHNFDIAQWGMNTDDSGPIGITPPTDPKASFGAKLTYASGIQVIHGGPAGVTFTGSKGTISVWRDRLLSIPDDILSTPLPANAATLPRHANHVQNFIDCVKSRQKPICDVEVGARSVALAHLCNLAYWHRRPMRWDPAAWEFVKDTEANGWRDYQRRPAYPLPQF